jgi:O-acetyl-ADP-ribose deacetylase (regulator of RNase III)
VITTFLNGRVTVKVGDLTEELADAIVNAANSSLLGGGGVDGAIHLKGGPTILEECRRIRETTHPGGLPSGEAVITSGGELPAKHVIHTVGPIYGMNNGRDAELLAQCYVNSLNLAVAHDLATIAFPAISTGVYGYPKPEAAKVASGAIAEWLVGNTSLAEIRLVFFSAAGADLFSSHSLF